MLMRSSTPNRLLGAFSTLLLVAVAVSWVAFLRPPALGGGTHYVMVSGDSMNPNMESGDFVIAREQARYEVGDVIVYSVPEGEVGAGSLIIHRVIGRSGEEGYVTQGDNPEITVPDMWRPTGQDISGKLWVHIPAAGKLIPYLRSPLILGLLAGLFAFWFVMGTGQKKPDEDAEPEEATADPEQTVADPEESIGGEHDLVDEEPALSSSAPN